MEIEDEIRRIHSRKHVLKLNGEFIEYRDVLAEYIIKMALMLEWYGNKKSRRSSIPDLFLDDNFIEITGVQNTYEDDNPLMHPRRRKENEGRSEEKHQPIYFKKILSDRLEELKENPKLDILPLFQNIRMLSDLLGLNKADIEVLIFASLTNLFPMFRNVIGSQNIHASSQYLCQIISALSGLPKSEIVSSISQNSVLITTGIIKVGRGICDLEDKLDLINGLSAVLLTSHTTPDELVSKFLKKATVPTLSLTNFPHLAKDTEVILPYLKNALNSKAEGINILLHGKPGVGKTEYVLAVAKEMGIDLYEITYSDEDGDPIKGEARLRAYSLCQNIMAKSTNSMLIFDEIEDVFPSNMSSLFSMLFGGRSVRSDSSGKAYINHTMERNPIPSFWISNEIRQIDHAYLRRFDYSMEFPVPPKAVRLSIAEHHLNAFEPSSSWLEKISSSDEITPAQLEKSAKVARLASGGDNIKAIELVEQTLEKSTILLGQKKLSNTRIMLTGYNLEYLNTDMDIQAIINGVKKKGRGTFCFYGSPGTGKSELARHIADEIGKPFLLKRASDILSMYVGEAEKNIAAMFNEARQQEALLVLDEADSFLSDRRNAQRSWEVTQVNELLTQMEAYNGLFICTTNLMDNLDPASLRRFAFKIQFNPLNQQQRISMFRNELSRLGGEESTTAAVENRIAALEGLTPGDFAVAARQFELFDIPATAESLLGQLQKECLAKGGMSRKIGFGC